MSYAQKLINNYVKGRTQELMTKQNLNLNANVGVMSVFLSGQVWMNFFYFKIKITIEQT